MLVVVSTRPFSTFLSFSAYHSLLFAYICLRSFLSLASCWIPAWTFSFLSPFTVHRSHWLPFVGLRSFFWLARFFLLVLSISLLSLDSSFGSRLLGSLLLLPLPLYTPNVFQSVREHLPLLLS
jgi:hypothetical protein